MNCSECEQLFDAYLDGQLLGSLRLEFDAHRLRCRRCQQSLAMLEAVGHVIGGDPRSPELSGDFVDRVMAEVATPTAPRRLTVPWTRVAIVAAALAQAAAIVAAVILWNVPRTDGPVAGPGAGAAEMARFAADPEFRAVHKLIVEGVEDSLWEIHHTGRRLTEDLVTLGRYLDIVLPEDVARESSRMAGANPWNFLWSPMSPGEEEPPETSSGDTVYSI